MNSASVCVRTLSAGLLSFYFFSVRQPVVLSDAPGERVSAHHNDSVTFSGKSEALVILSCFWRNAAHKFFHPLVDFLSVVGIFFFYCRAICCLLLILNFLVFLLSSQSRHCFIGITVKGHFANMKLIMDLNINKIFKMSETKQHKLRKNL